MARAITDFHARAHLAYDDPSDKTHVAAAAGLMLAMDPRKRKWLSCYVLVGFDGDRIPEAAERLEWVKSLGVTPVPMYYLPKDAKTRRAPPDWAPFVRLWSRPAIVWAKKSTKALT